MGIRLADRNDKSKIALLYPSPSYFDNIICDVTGAKESRILQKEKEYVYIKNTDNSNIIGHGELYSIQSETSTLSLKITSQNRDLAIAKKLLELLIQDANSFNGTRIELNVYSQDSGSIRLFERCGFIRGEYKKHRIGVALNDADPMKAKMNPYNIAGNRLNMSLELC